MANQLKGQVALITGGGRGIGRAIAESYAGAGCRLTLVSRTVQELETTARAIREQYGAEVSFFTADVSDEQNFKAVVESIKSAWGRVDVLVNCASIIGPLGPMETIDSQEWSKALHVNLTGTFYTMKAVLPLMRKQGSGRIINFSGGGALLPAPFFDAYSVSKAGVVRLTENLALELKGTGILVCAISPGGVNTRMFDDMMAAGESKVGKELWNSFLKRKMEGGDSMADVSSLALFLATTDRIDALQGRVISAKWDPWRKFSEHYEEMAQSDVYTMRRIMPKDRNCKW